MSFWNWLTGKKDEAKADEPIQPKPVNVLAVRAESAFNGALLGAAIAAVALTGLALVMAWSLGANALILAAANPLKAIGLGWLFGGAITSGIGTAVTYAAAAIGVGTAGGAGIGALVGWARAPVEEAKIEAAREARQLERERRMSKLRETAPQRELADAEREYAEFQSQQQPMYPPIAPRPRGRAAEPARRD